MFEGNQDKIKIPTNFDYNFLKRLMFSAKEKIIPNYYYPYYNIIIIKHQYSKNGVGHSEFHLLPNTKVTNQ